MVTRALTSASTWLGCHTLDGKCSSSFQHVLCNLELGLPASTFVMGTLVDGIELNFGVVAILMFADATATDRLGPVTLDATGLSCLSTRDSPGLNPLHTLQFWQPSVLRILRRGSAVAVAAAAEPEPDLSPVEFTIQCRSPSIAGGDLCGRVGS